MITQWEIWCKFKRLIMHIWKFWGKNYKLANMRDQMWKVVNWPLNLSIPDSLTSWLPVKACNSDPEHDHHGEEDCVNLTMLRRRGVAADDDETWLRMAVVLLWQKKRFVQILGFNLIVKETESVSWDLDTVASAAIQNACTIFARTSHHRFY